MDFLVTPASPVFLEPPESELAVILEPLDSRVRQVSLARTPVLQARAAHQVRAALVGSPASPEQAARAQVAFRARLGQAAILEHLDFPVSPERLGSVEIILDHQAHLAHLARQERPGFQG